VGSVAMWALSKYMCESLQKFFMLLVLDFMPPNQISNMSMNGLRRQVSSQDKNQTGTRMDEPSVALDLGNWVLSKVAPPLSYSFPKLCVLEDL